MFSVIIPIHNKLPHLDRSINSVLNQSYQNFEIILIDDASSDGSEDKIYEFKDPRIRILKRDVPGAGGYAARNKGIMDAKYNLIAFLDADDKWEETYLEEVYNTFEKHPNVNLVSSGWVYCNEGEYSQVPGFSRIKGAFKRISLTDYFNYNLLIWTSAVVIKKGLLMNSGLFPEGKCKRGGDMDTWIRCLSLSKDNIFINKNLAVYYRDTVNRVTDNKKTNLSFKMCSFDTIHSIQSTTKDSKLSAAIDRFCSKHLLSLMIKNLRAGNKYNVNDLRIITSKRRRMTVLSKFYLYRLLFTFKIK